MDAREVASSDEATTEDPLRGLGDLAGEFFGTLGITEARYRAVKLALHLDPKCGCADRRRWLNEMGDRLGVDGVIVKLARWMDRERRQGRRFGGESRPADARSLDKIQ
jgi:hypothetical protein